MRSALLFTEQSRKNGLRKVPKRYTVFCSRRHAYKKKKKHSVLRSDYEEQNRREHRERSKSKANALKKKLHKKSVTINADIEKKEVRKKRNRAPNSFQGILQRNQKKKKNYISADVC